MTTTTTVRAYTKVVNGEYVHVDAYTRGIGEGYTRDGGRKARAAREFTAMLEARARRGDATAAARLGYWPA